MVSWTEEVRSDELRVLASLRRIVSFQLASALKSRLDVFLSAPEQLGLMVLMWAFVSCAARCSRADLYVARSVLVVQAGQSVLAVVSHAGGWAAGGVAAVALGFLTNTFALCLPSLLSVVCPALMQTDYVQNAISVYLFQYATASRELLARVDFGVSPAIFCLLALSVSSRVSARVLEAVHLYKHVFQAWHMLLVDWLLRVAVESGAGLPPLLQISVLLMLVIAVDELGLGRLEVLRDVRGYTVYRVAGAMQSLASLSGGAAIDGSASSLAAALLLLCTRSVLRILRVHSRVVDSFSEIFFVACVNVLLQDVASSPQEDVRLLRVSLVCVLAYQINALLTVESRQEPAAKSPRPRS
jgi:hypothetical protein